MSITGSISMRNPGHILPFPLPACAEGAALFTDPSNDDAVILPPSGFLPASLRFVGLARYANATAGLSGDVVTEGVWPGIASGAIARNTRVVVANTAGAVKAFDPFTDTGADIIGVSLESAADGERVAIHLGESEPHAGVILPFTAGRGGVLARHGVVTGSADRQVVLPASPDPAEGVVGVALNDALEGETAWVVCLGPAVVIDSGSGITRGAFVALAATGTGKTAPPYTGTNTMTLGYAFDTLAASGTGVVFVNPGAFQGVGAS